MLFPGRYFRLQLLEPVEDDDHAASRRVRTAVDAVLDHQESPAVRRHVVMARGVWLEVLSVEELRGSASDERRSRRLHGHGGQSVRSIEEEELAAVAPPRRARSARRRDLPRTAAYVGKCPHIDFQLAGFVRLVREVSTVRRDLCETASEEALSDRACHGEAVA